RSRAVPRRGHDRLRDDAVGEPGAHAHGAQAGKGERGGSNLPQMGPRLRGGGRDHADQAPEYNRPFREAVNPASIDAASIKLPLKLADALEKLIATPDLCSKRWVWEQYDHIIG